ncbi:hypothetical protein F4777DRAFT_263734 [Nemania sp. FL0916]|nr:hypothetical protein F4777DRAFT_263734 [Nemania sp. FL0916]
MKFVLVLTALVSTASAWRCTAERFKPTVKGNCASGHKAGDQNEGDSCSDKHPDSCYFKSPSSAGDSNCRIQVSSGSGCNPATIIGVVYCNSSAAVFSDADASYVVLCD